MEREEAHTLINENDANFAITRSTKEKGMSSTKRKRNGDQMIDQLWKSRLRLTSVIPAFSARYTCSDILDIIITRY